MAAGNYPAPRPPEGEVDPRFTRLIMLRVADALQEEGFPVPIGTDWVDLQQALFTFIYGPRDGAS
jgi:hypothetical protein